jgi:hypothetical protein
MCAKIPPNSSHLTHPVSEARAMAPSFTVHSPVSRQEAIDGKMRCKTTIQGSFTVHGTRILASVSSAIRVSDRSSEAKSDFPLRS